MNILKTVRSLALTDQLHLSTPFLHFKDADPEVFCRLSNLNLRYTGTYFLVAAAKNFGHATCAKHAYTQCNCLARGYLLSCWHFQWDATIQ